MIHGKHDVFDTGTFNCSSLPRMYTHAERTVTHQHSAKTSCKEYSNVLGLYWVTKATPKSVQGGQVIMMAGYGAGLCNATVYFTRSDHVYKLEKLGCSNAAIMALLPADVNESKATAMKNATVWVQSQDGSIRSNSLALYSPELWWIQGDEGANSTQGGWVRCFGRMLSRGNSVRGPSRVRG